MSHKFTTETVFGDRFYYNRLFHDYIFDYQAFKDFFHYDHGSIEGYEKRMRDIGKNYDENIRSTVSGILEDNNRRLGAGEKSMENIKGLSEKGSMIVIGGQQPGLFTGPIFMIYKIITILKLSSYIGSKTGKRIIPCFWNASDDSSIDQADRLGMITDRYDELKIDTSGINRDSRLSNIYFPWSSYLDLIDEMSLLLHGKASEDEAGLFLKETVYDLQEKGGDSAGIGLAQLFSSIILKLFSKWGPVIIDPADSSLKELGSAFLEWDLKEHSKINSTIVESGKKLTKLGYHSQLTPNLDVLDFFIDKDGAREKIKILPNGRYELTGKEYTGENLLKKAVGDHSQVSWNVVLRPLVQDTVLPVLATVCGPGEVSYFAQLGGVYTQKGMNMPIIYPRFSATVLEERTARLMGRSGIGIEDLCLEKEDALKIVLKNHEAEDMEVLVGELDSSISVNIDDIENRMNESGIDPGSAFDRIKRNLANEIKVLSKKIYSALKKQNQMIVKNIDGIYLDLFPDGSLQERKINIFYYAGKYGMKVIDLLYEAYKPLDKGHKFIYLKEDKKDEKG